MHNAPGGGTERRTAVSFNLLDFFSSGPSRYRSKFQFSDRGLSHRINNSISHPCSLSQLYEETQCYFFFSCQACEWAYWNIAFRNCTKMLKSIHSARGGSQSRNYVFEDGSFFKVRIQQIRSQIKELGSQQLKPAGLHRKQVFHSRRNLRMEMVGPSLPSFIELNLFECLGRSSQTTNKRDTEISKS